MLASILKIADRLSLLEELRRWRLGSARFSPAPPVSGPSETRRRRSPATHHGHALRCTRTGGCAMNEGSTARESAPYRAARDRLLEQEIALRRMTEAVAEQRRRLPPGPPVPEDYLLRRAGSGASVRLSKLFGDGDALPILAWTKLTCSGKRSRHL
jgi:hypothetical protein